MHRSFAFLVGVVARLFQSVLVVRMPADFLSVGQGVVLTWREMARHDATVKSAINEGRCESHATSLRLWRCLRRLDSYDVTLGTPSPDSLSSSSAKLVR